MAHVVSPEGKKKDVKNLGWLIRNWKSVESFSISKSNEPGYGATGAHMVAHLRSGGMYVTEWASKEVCRDWLRRPVFRGIELVWFGEKTKA